MASGWLGVGAFESGAPGAMLGLVSHFFILFVAAYLYLVASRRFAFLATQAIACGALFGAGVYLFMNFMVLKLSAFPFKLTYDGLRLLEALPRTRCSSAFLSRWRRANGAWPGTSS